MVQAEGVEQCACWDRAGSPCGAASTTWRVSWDVTRRITVVSGSCAAHAKPITRAAVRKWGTHDVSHDVARAVARGA